MSTRSKTRSSLSSKASEPVNATLKSQGRTHTHDAQSDDMDVGTHTGEGKENVKAVASKTTMAPPSRVRQSKQRKTRTRESLRTVDCICSKGDDGSPMVLCSQCQIWYHFTCVDISEPEAEEISVYVCPTCTTSTGSRSAMVWEGDQAIEEGSDDESAISARRQVALKVHKAFPEHKIKQSAEESEESSSSEDEYTEEKKVNSPKDQRLGRLPRLSTVSDTDSIAEASKRRTNRIKQSTSPSPSIHGPAKRKASFVHQSSSPPPSKKKRPRESHSGDDPVRKYCLTKLEELFKDVFLRYPHVRVSASGSDEPPSASAGSIEEQEQSKIVPKKLEELSDEKKDALIKESQQFSQDLENCVFEIYSEPDKSGNPHASGKYKERFRMLQFNLSKVDRVIIHQRITSGTISPKEISLMSSTDLADEETKQHIKLAEKEALEHSILLKSTVPRAKITHKGLQDIEDVNGEVATSREIEVHKEREQEEEERRERERSARLRATQRQRTASISVPPESPTVQQSPTMGDQLWGGPPPVPAHAMSPTAADFASSGSRPPVFMHTPDLNTTELELNLADLINIDDEQDPSAFISQSTFGSNIVSSPVDATSPSHLSIAPTGISPFAARPERQRGASFDLNSLWNMATKDDSAQTTEPAPEPAPIAAPEPSIASVLTEEPGADGSDKDEAMELESVEANDQDFDMFLEEKETEQEQSEELIVTPIPPRNIEALPEVWTGKLTMPLDSSVPQETSLVARQIAGRPLPADSPLWKTLFPSEQLRIEGRVAVENSVKYLVGMRLNAAKELYAAAFVPSTPGHEQDFKTFCDFLIAKGRHGLVFPWGSRPKEYHPGRELYMIPLRQSEPLPEFVELLDELKLPKIRNRDYLLGVWILNKGKLAVLPGASQPPPVPMVSLPPQPQPQPQPSHTPPLNLSIFNNLPPLNALNTTPLSSIPSLPPSIPGLPIARDTLAAEVASLTPEQLQEVLRTLASTQLPPMPQPGPPPMPPQMHNIHRPPMHHVPTPPMGVPTPPMGVPTPPMGNTPPMMSTPQSWMQAPPAPYANYPPPNVPFQQPPAHGVHGMNPSMPTHFDRPDYERPDYDRQKYDRDFQPSPNYQQGGSGMRGDNRGERGWRGNAGNRGGNQRTNSGGGLRGARGRGSGEGSDFTARRDSGWPRRQRSEGHSGPSW